MSRAFKLAEDEFPELSKKEILELLKPVYEQPGRTKQAFKDDCDVNRILQKAQKVGSLSHLQKHGAFYGDFANAPKDLFEAREMLDRGEAIFKDLPAEIRNEFENDALKFFGAMNDPANVDRRKEVMEELAKPGRYFLDMSPQTPPGALKGEGADPVVAEPQSSEEARVEPQEAPVEPQEAPKGP